MNDIKNEIKNIEDNHDEDNIDSTFTNYESFEENNINTYFKLPIHYQKSNKKLNQKLIDDLELKDNNSNSSIYKNIFSSINEEKKYTTPENQLIEQWSESFTTNKQFLKNSQTITKNLKHNSETNGYKKLFNVYDSWLNMKNLKYFNEKYQYLSWSFLEPLNNNSFFLTFLSYYNLSSPVFSLLMPLLMLIIPFFILKLKGINITIAGYWNVLKVILQNNSIIKLFTNFSTSSLQEKSYLIISVIFYVIQIYQNIESCIMFYNNLNNIMNLYDKLKHYIQFSLNNMNNYLKISNKYKSYGDFNDNIKQNIQQLELILKKINSIIKPNSFVFQLNQIGYIMKIYYKLYNNNNFHSSIMYSFGFNIYYNHLQQLNNHIINTKLNICKFNKKKSY